MAATNKLPTGGVLRLVLLSAAAFLAPTDGAATSPIVDVSCTENVELVCKALREEDPDRRLAEGRKAIRAALWSADAATREQGASLLSRLLHRMDLRPFADLFEEVCKTGGRCFWTAQQADWTDVRFGSLSFRVGVLETAIRRGGGHLPRGTPISRVQAVQTAARQGLDELAPLSQEYLDTLTAVRRKSLSLETAPALFELSGGAETEMEAPAVALTRLEEMNDEELFGRLQEEEPFRAAVMDIAGRACEGDAVTGARRGCGAVGRIVARLKPLGPRPEPGDLRGSPIEWLRRLDDLSAPRVLGGDLAEKTVSASRRPAQPAGIDPCTLPEISDAERWTSGPTTVGGYYVILRDLPSGADGAVSVADGIRGHRSGRTIRLKLDIRNRSDARPTYPVVMRVILSGKGGGSLSAPGRRQGCASMNFFWNRAASNGTSLVNFDEVDLTIGSAELAGTIPHAEIPREPVPLWRTTSQLEIHFARIREEDGSAMREGAGVFDVRPEGTAVPATLPRPFDGLLTRKAEALQALFFGPDLGEDPIVTRDPTRQYVALVDRERTEDERPVICFSQRENGARVTEGEAVALRRLGDSPIFVGTFIALPEGYPGPETEIGRPLQPPAVVIPVGRGDIGCEDPSSP